MLRIAVLTVSDTVSRGETEDRGGPAVRQALESENCSVVELAVSADDRDAIATILRGWCDGPGVDAIFTTGGTGLGPRDVTPEATLDVADRIVPGIAEALRADGLRHTQNSMLSRNVAVMRRATLIVNLPGSPSGALEGLQTILPVLEHAVATARGARH